jgi:hypothetical protein
MLCVDTSRRQVAFWSNRDKDAEEKAELAEYASWIKEIREPDVDNNGIRRLEAEIRAKRNDILNELSQRYVRPRLHNITKIRREVDTLKGMVFAWLYVSGKWEGVSALNTVTETVNDLAMLWLSVDLLKMDNAAYPKKAPKDV